MKFLGSIWSGSGHNEIKKKCFKTDKGYLVKVFDSISKFKEIHFKDTTILGLTISAKTKFQIWLFFQSSDVRLGDE
jgi:hypothetical protein